MAKLSGMRSGTTNSGSGDYQSNPFQPQRCYQQSQQQEIDWDLVAHPSHDLYGPVNALQYFTRRHMMGRNHPAYAYLTLPRTLSGTGNYIFYHTLPINSIRISSKISIVAYSFLHS